MSSTSHGTSDDIDSVDVKQCETHLIDVAGRTMARIAQSTKEHTLVPDLWYAALQATTRNREAIAYTGGHAIDPARTLPPLGISFEDIEDLSNCFANWGMATSLRRGDAVAFMCTNRLEFFPFWLGMSKLGVTSALINYSLRQRGLSSSIGIVEPRAVVFELAFAAAIFEVREQLPASAALFGLDDSVYTHLQRRSKKQERTKEQDQTQEFASPGWGTVQSFCTVLTPANYSSQPVPVERSARAQKVGVNDPLLYIYTSGTTGLPKAATITTKRYVRALHALSCGYPITHTDRVYCALPLYHSSACILGLGLLLGVRCTFVLSPKFSATRFWKEVHGHQATVIQYIGELCRYLLAAPRSSHDQNHSCRLAFGNGLRPDIWREFQTRFAVRQVVEFYAATEGAMMFSNLFGKVGACGLLRPRLHGQTVKILKYDTTTDRLVKNAQDRYVEADVNEPGHLIIRIEKAEDGSSNFSGYRDQKATATKILTGVASADDQWFLSGDLLKTDRDGFLFFVDRIGDTFRWKGENVSTNEVEDVLQQYLQSKRLSSVDINVYGVAVPGQDGRAGMVALSGIDGCNAREVAAGLDLRDLAGFLQKHLPSYAVPLFLRIMDSHMDVTGTLKHSKGRLVREGFSRVGTDPIFVLQRDAYIPLIPAKL